MSKPLPRCSTGPALATRASLIDLVQGSDPTGWQRLNELYRPLLCHWARQFGAGLADCEDISQDVFRVVIKRIGSFRRGDQEGSFRAWLRQITCNVCRERRRSNGHFHRACGGTDAAIRLSEIADQLMEDDDPPELKADLYRRAIALVQGEFSDRDWAVFKRLVFDERPPAEVAVEIGLTVQNVRKIKSRIYCRLRKELGEIRGDDTPVVGR